MSLLLSSRLFISTLLGSFFILLFLFGIGMAPAPPDASPASSSSPIPGILLKFSLNDKML